MTLSNEEPYTNKSLRLGVIRMRGIPSELYRVYDGAACDDSC